MTSDTWDYCRRSNMVNGDLASAPKDDLELVLHVICWNRLKCDQLVAMGQPGAALVLANIGMMSGAGRAAQILQECAGVVCDRIIGPMTLLQVQHREPGTLISAMSDKYLSYLQSLGDWPKFGAGWGRRVHDARTLALTLHKTA